MKKLTLQKSKWICGKPIYNTISSNCLGDGDTQLLNKEGFMCCLGQFSLQEGATKEQILDANIPSSLNVLFSPLLVTAGRNPGMGNLYNTPFSTRAMYINDDQRTTIEKKISELTVLCKEYEIELEVIE